jgi:hypothetical protein
MSDDAFYDIDRLYVKRKEGGGGLLLLVVVVVVFVVVLGVGWGVCCYIVWSSPCRTGSNVLF